MPTATCQIQCQSLGLGLIASCPRGSVVNVSSFSDVQGKVVSEVYNRLTIQTLVASVEMSLAACLPSNGANATCVATYLNAQKKCSTLTDTAPAEKCSNGPCRTSLLLMEAACSQATTSDHAFKALAKSLTEDLCLPCAQSLAQFIDMSGRCDQASMCSASCLTIACGAVARCPAGAFYNVTVLGTSGLEVDYLSAAQVGAITGPINHALATCSCDGALRPIIAGDPLPTLNGTFINVLSQNAGILSSYATRGVYFLPMLYLVLAVSRA